MLDLLVFNYLTCLSLVPRRGVGGGGRERKQGLEERLVNRARETKVGWVRIRPALTGEASLSLTSSLWSVHICEGRLRMLIGCVCVYVCKCWWMASPGYLRLINSFHIGPPSITTLMLCYENQYLQCIIATRVQSQTIPKYLSCYSVCCVNHRSLGSVD